MRIRITAVVEPDEGGFHAYCPAFKGLHMDGRTEEEALARTVDGLKLYLDSLERHGDPIPVGPECVVEDNRPKIDAPEISPNALVHPLEVQWHPSAVPL